VPVPKHSKVGGPNLKVGWGDKVFIYFSPGKACRA